MATETMDQHGGGLSERWARMGPAERMQAEVAGSAALGLLSLTRRSTIGRLLFAVPAFWLARRAFDTAYREGLMGSGGGYTSVGASDAQAVGSSDRQDFAARTHETGAGGAIEVDSEQAANEAYGIAVAAGPDVGSEVDLTGDPFTDSPTGS